MAADPIWQRLAPGRLAVGVARRAHGGNEDGRLAYFAGAAVGDRYRVAGVVDEQLLARRVGLAHRHRQLANPAPVVLAKAAVQVVVRVALLVFLPQQIERHALAAQLSVQVRPFGQRTARARLRRRRVQFRLQHRIVPAGRHRVADAGERGPAHDLADRRARDADDSGNLPSAAPLILAQPQYLDNISHGQPPIRHLIFNKNCRGWHGCPACYARSWPSVRLPIRWPNCRGTGGRIAME